jgi:hypothetical protein
MRRLWGMDSTQPPPIQQSMQPGEVDPESSEELAEAGGRSLRTQTSSSSPKARETCRRLLELPKRPEVVAGGPMARAHQRCHALVAQALEACRRLLELPKGSEVVAGGPAARARRRRHAPIAQAP